MALNKVFSTGVLVSSLCLCVPDALCADTVTLRNGAVVEGTVVQKTDMYLVLLPDSGLKTYYLAERVEKINGKSYQAFRLPVNKLLTQRFRAPKGKRYPNVTLTLRDGRTVKGDLLERNPDYFRMQIEGSDKAEEFLVENIIKAE